MNSYLLSPAALHAAAPGVLDVVFGPDGDFEGAPYWTGPVVEIDPTGNGGVYHVAALLSGEFVAPIEPAPMMAFYAVALDLRVPSVAARLAGLLLAAGFSTHDAQDALLMEDALLSAVAPQKWTEQQAARLAAWVLAGAAKIAAFRRPA